MTTKTVLEEMFLRRKPVHLLLNLKSEQSKYVSVLAKQTDCTYSHTVKLLEEFKDLGLVTFEKEGRVKFISFTKEGEELANAFENVMRKFSKIKPITTIEKKEIKEQKPIKK